MTARGLKPIFGCEFYHGTKHGDYQKQRDQAHLIALAMNDKGLHNLWALSNTTAAEDHFYHVGRIFKEDILKYKEGIVFTSACALGLVPKGLMQDDYTWLNWYLDNLRDQFYIEISTYPGDSVFNDSDLDGTPITQRIITEALVNVAVERGIEVVYGDDGHYAFPDHFKQHDAYIARQTGQTIFTPIEDRKMYHPPDAVCIKDEEMVRRNLSYLPDFVVDQAISNAVKIGEQAQAQLPEVRRHLPVFVPGECPWLSAEDRQKLDEDEAPAETLFLQLVVDGIYRRYGDNPSQKVWDRTFYECETLIHDGIHHYFLMGWDEIMFCDSENIARGPGRGSSAGCIVAYALGITDIDPLHYGLIFERFWNSGRAEGFPDIDSDFSQAHRQRIIGYLKARYGADRVCDIGTVGRMKPKKVCENLAACFGISNVECDELKAIVGKTIDIEIHGHEQIGWSREHEPGKVIYVEDCVGDEIQEWIDADPRRADIREGYVEMCRKACSRVHLYGIHPSGIVVSDIPTGDELPSYLRGKKEERRPATQFAMDDVDKRFFVKLDVLGLRTLDTLEHWRDMMRKKGVNIEWSGLDLQEHPDEMWDSLEDGFAAGIFQVESGIPKRLCELLGPRSVSDLAVIGALIRPGPQGDGTMDTYLARRRRDNPVTYAHPKLEELLHPYLEETYGLFVYQEQVIGYFNALGYSLKESDAVRKILGKKKPEALGALHDGTGEWEGRGYISMAKAAGLPEDIAQDVWDGLERFASYSFNKSHAVAYAIIGFRCVFAKYYGPAEFYASCVRTAENEKRKIMLPLYVNEARRLGLEVSPPDIRHSEGWTSVIEDDVLFGFGDVKGVGASGFYMADLRDEFDYSTPEIFAEQFEALNKEYLATKKKLTKDDPDQLATFLTDNPKSPKQMLGANKIEAVYKAGAWDHLIEPDISMAERQALEEELLGVILSDYTKEAFEANAAEVEQYAEYWNELTTPFAEKLSTYDDTDDVSAFAYKVPGIVTGVQEKRGKKSGKSFGIVTIEYGSHSLEFMVFNAKWKSHKFLFRMRTPGIFAIKQTPASEQYGESYQFTGGYALQP